MMLFLRGFTVTVLGIALGWCLMILSVFLFGYRDEARQVDAIVVLGAAQYDGRPSPVLKARLDHAIELFQRDLAPRLITTGGVGVGDTVSEAEVGRRYATRHGVAQEAILIETGGLSSEASMRAVAALMRQNGLSSALLVSDPFHMLRLRLLATQLDIDAYSSPTRTSPIDPESTEVWRHVFRESLIVPTVLLGDRVPEPVAQRAGIE